MPTDSNEVRLSLLEHRMDILERNSAEMSRGLDALAKSLSQLSTNINQVKWVVVGAVVASYGSQGLGVVTKLIGI